MSTNKKGWSYQKQTVQEIYNYLEYDERFFEMTEKNALTAVKYYVDFCYKFKDNLIPDINANLNRFLRLFGENHTSLFFGYSIEKE